MRFEDALVLVLAMDHRARGSALHDRYSQRLPVGPRGEEHSNNTEENDDNRRVDELPPMVAGLDQQRSSSSERDGQHGPTGRSNKLNASEERREPARCVPDVAPRESAKGEPGANELDDGPRPDRDEPPSPRRPEAEEPYHQTVEPEVGRHQQHEGYPGDEPEDADPEQQQSEEHRSPEEAEGDSLKTTLDTPQPPEQRNRCDEGKRPDVQRRERSPHQQGAGKCRKVGKHESARVVRSET